jgi:hypothetical protein
MLLPVIVEKRIDVKGISGAGLGTELLHQMCKFPQPPGTARIMCARISERYARASRAEAIGCAKNKNGPVNHSRSLFQRNREEVRCSSKSLPFLGVEPLSERGTVSKTMHNVAHLRTFVRTRRQPVFLVSY